MAACQVCPASACLARRRPEVQFESLPGMQHELSREAPVSSVLHVYVCRLVLCRAARNRTPCPTVATHRIIPAGTRTLHDAY